MAITVTYNPEVICIGGGISEEDWFINELKLPSFTVEIGKGKNPLPLSNLEEMETEVKGRLFSEAFEAEEFPIVEEKKATLGGLFDSKAEVDDILFNDSESYIEEEALEQSENKDNSNSKKC